MVSAILVVLWATGNVQDQSTDSGEKGFTAFEEVRASTSNFGQLLTADTNLGYDFNRFVGSTWAFQYSSPGGR
jgi:hypothetical protein